MNIIPYRRAGAPAACGVIISMIASAAAADPSAAPRTVLHGTVPAVVLAATPTGRVSPNQQITCQFTLPLRNQAQLNDLLKGLYDPKDPRFHHFLTPAEFRSQFAPTEADYNTLISYATSAGLTVTGTHETRTLLTVSAPAATMEKAFSVVLQNFQSADGQTFHGTTVEPSIASSISGIVSGVVGLDNAQVAHTHSRQVPIGPRPLTQTLQPSGHTQYFLSPSQMNTAFNIPAISQPGSGQTLGLFELDGYLASDITGYTSNFGLSTPTLENVVIPGFPGGTGSGQFEVTLDIDMMIALAPKASRILVYEAANPGGILSCYAKIASDNRAKAISTSWGIWETANSTAVLSNENSSFAQMAAQGQSIFAASGDSGAYDDSTNLSVDDPASQPYMVGVGGTDIFLNSDFTYNHETAWGDPTDTSNGRPKGNGSGGGISSVWSIPSYQTGFITGANSTSTTKRNVPDVSLFGDYDTGFYLVMMNGNWYGGNGTSAAAPLWAGFTALVNQARAAQGNSTLGFPNPTLYKLGASSLYNSVFHDVTTLNNLFYSAGTGYDLATGLGSFNGTTMLSALVPPAAPALSLQSVTSTTATLTWPAVTNATSYSVYRGTSAGGESASPIASGITTNSFADTTLASGTTYYYKVTASSIAGESVASNEVSATAVVNNPSPAITSLSPSSVVAGAGNTNLTVTGTGFVSGSVIKYNGTSLTTTFNSSTSLSAVIPSSSLTTPGTASITVFTPAPGGGTSNSLTFTIISATTLSTLTVNPAAVTGGNSATVTITLSGAAPAGGTAVSLSSSDGVLIPAGTTVTIPAGATSGTYTVNTNPSGRGVAITITAAYNGASKTATLTIATATLATMTATPVSVSPGSPVAITVTLTGPSPAGGTAVSLASNSAALPVPATVTVPAGSTSATANVTATSVASNTTVTVTASYARVAKTANVTVLSGSAPVVISAISLNATAASSPTAVTGTVTLSAPAGSGGVTVTLSSSNSAAAAVPASVTVAAGATTATFPVTLSSVAADTQVTISGTTGSTTKTTTLTVQAPAAVTLKSVSVNPTSAHGGTTVTITVTLTSPAPAGGVVVGITGSDRVTINGRTSVTVPAGATTQSVLVTLGPVAANAVIQVVAKTGTSSASTPLQLLAP